LGGFSVVKKEPLLGRYYGGLEEAVFGGY